MHFWVPASKDTDRPQVSFTRLGGSVHYKTPIPKSISPAHRLFGHEQRELDCVLGADRFQGANLETLHDLASLPLQVLPVRALFDDRSGPGAAVLPAISRMCPSLRALTLYSIFCREMGDLEVHTHVHVRHGRGGQDVYPAPSVRRRGGAV